MMSFLILPVQRVPRYELLARDIQRKADLFPDLLYGTHPMVIASLVLTGPVYGSGSLHI